ncbi:pimeloyl-ACP methyl ester carboxylesterase [Bacillus mesophilus]|uniref:Alpha/beta hydrolase n=1 Tax=Bacillus mesophilus TaxID=1808955 RepID=A0A6M0Q2G1_9BACI|nr:alpha/beta hydrolase [Bacillus mesophilus]MBM7659608.1 pimeloyl-ACP methyl ester carboxylesterase [Bacillus mesophilus]NEY70477.1 alpha/beta hydrolase [Bacillus mesophilus]
MLQRQKVKINNVTVSYIDEGSGSTIVLIHGFCGSPAYWEKIIPDLSKTHRIIVPALRGHGMSSAINDPYSIEDMATDLKNLLDELQIQEVTLLGHSLGGYVTLAFAEKYPEFLSGFGLIHSTAFPDSEEAKQGRQNNIDLISENGIEPLITSLVPKLFSPTNEKEMGDEVRVVTEIGLNTSVTGAKGALRAMQERPDRNAVLKGATCPILLVAGKQDQLIPVEKVFSVQSPFTQQVLMEEVGHLGMIEDPKTLTNIIRDFVQGKVLSNN